MSEAGKRTPKEFLREHGENMQGDALFQDLPFYRWLKERDAAGEAPSRFVPALREYYAGHEITGAFTAGEVSNYRHIYGHFWDIKTKGS